MAVGRSRGGFAHFSGRFCGNTSITLGPRTVLDGLSASAAPQDWCDPDRSEEELGPDMKFMESYGRVEQRRQHLARDASHDDGRAAA
jgi:hypothetical protein